MSCTVRAMMRQDAPRLHAVACACFSQPWSRVAFEQEWESPTARTLVALQGERIEGFLNAWVICGECTINNVGIVPDCRRQGVASRLLEALLVQAQQEQYEFITLEVRRSNTPAIKLYENYGFKRVGERKGFYTDPTEDALLMTRFLDKGESS